LWPYAAEFVSKPIESAGYGLRGTAMVADVSGFSALTDRLTREGPAGLARLSNELNRVLGRMAEIIRDHGGDLETTSGDSVLALWPVTDEDQTDAALSALACAQAMLASLDEVGTQNGVVIRLRVAMVSGDVRMMHLGGVAGHWMHVLSGPPLFRLAGLLDQTAPGQISADADTVAILGRMVETRRAGTDAVLITGNRGHHVSRGANLAKAPSVDEDAALVPFLSPPLRARQARASGGWVAEIRTITVMFLSLTGIEPASEGVVAVIQKVIAEIQTVLARFDAHVHALSMHDKGPMVMVVFGLPGEAHADDAFRAVRAAREVQAVLERLWLDSTCGIATGRAYCGPVGEGDRLAFSVIGDVVNRASRLQSAARFRIQCDQETVSAVGGRMRFERMGDVTLKGIATPVIMFCPRLEVDLGAAEGPSAALRGQEFERLVTAVGAQPGAPTGESRIAVLTGEAGMGKSSLVQRLVDHVTAMGWTALSGRTDPFNREVPFLSWRRIFARLIDLDPAMEPAEAMAIVVGRIDAIPGLAQRAALFNPVLPFVIPDSPVTLSMRGAARFESTVEAMAVFLAHALERDAALIVLDDSQWLDAGSTALVRRLLARRDGAAAIPFVLAGRPDDGMDDVRAAIQDSATQGPMSEIALAPLDEAEAALLVAATLRAGEVDPDLARFVRAKTGGNPFFVRELTLALGADGAIAVESGKVSAPGGMAKLSNARFPESVERTVLARYDRLPERQQMILRSAAVIGSGFGRDLMADLVGGTDRDGTLDQDLVDLVRDRLLCRLPDGTGEVEYAFDHMIAQETVYSLLLPADAARLHHRVASRLQDRADRADASVIAGHFDRAGDFRNAAEAWERSGTALLRVGTDRASILHLERAVEAIGKAGLQDDRLRLARLHRHLGEACNRLGQLVDAQANLEAGLIRLDRPWPVGKGRVTGAGLKGFMVQWWRSRVGQQSPGVSSVVEEAAERAALYSHLSHTLYFANRDIEIILAVVEQANHAEIAADRQLMADAYLQLSNVMGIFSLHGVAERYQARFAQLRPGLEPVTLARCNQLQSLYLASVGRLGECRDLLNEAMEIAETLGDQRYRREFLSLLGIVTLPLGEVAVSQDARRRFLELARSSSDQQALLWGLIEGAEMALHLGNHEEVEAFLSEAEPLLPRFGAGETIWAEGILARSCREVGKVARSIEVARRALGVIRKTMPVSYYTLEGYCGVAEVFVGVIEDGALSAAERRVTAKEAAAAIKALKKFSNSFPLARPRLLSLRSRLAACEGRRDATALAEQALAAAEGLSLPLESLHARLLLAGGKAGDGLVNALVGIDRAYADMQCQTGRSAVRRLAARHGVALPVDLPFAGDVAFTNDMRGIA
jgi:class 3 adenylate cyclase/tetratricopeptide (TPR) repeat protein